MADQKFTDLAAVTPPIDAGSLVAFSTYDGVSAYTSEKVTLTQLRDAVYLMEAEDKITFVEGTNLFFVQNSAGNNAGISFDSSIDYVGLEGDGVDQGWTAGYCYVEGAQFAAGFNEGVAGGILASSTAIDLTFSGTTRIKANTTGLGFFNTTPVAQPSAYTLTATAVPSKTLLASASATTTNNNNVIAQLVTDLQALGLIA